MRCVRSTLRTFNGTAKNSWPLPLKPRNSPHACVGAFDLPPAQHAAIQQAINQTFSADIHIQFETAPELVSGVELITNGQKVGWSIADYLATLEKSAAELLHDDAKPESKPGANSKPDAEPGAMSGQKPESKPVVETVPTAPKADH